MNEIKDWELDRILEAIVIVAWPDLARNGNALIHVEYEFSAKGDILFLQLWLSDFRGVWHLICTQSMEPCVSWDRGVQFANGYHSAQLASMLSLVTHHQEMFQRPQDLGRHGVLQITAPSTEEREEASRLIKETLDQIRSNELVLVEP